MLIGEAPGAQEDRKGRPFIGDAGRKLNYCLERAKINRKQILIGNAIRCRPPKNRTPRKKEIDACFPYLLRDILVNRPKVIVSLGSAAHSALDSCKRSLTRWRGFPTAQRYSCEVNGKRYEHECWLLPTFHPSAALHDWTLDDLIVFDLTNAKQIADGKMPLSEPDTKVVVADTFDAARALIGRLRRTNRFVCDLETTGLNPHTDQIICYGFCMRSGEAHILPILRSDGRPYWDADRLAVLRNDLADMFEGAKIVGQNFKFDAKFIRKQLGVSDINIVFDTQNAHHVLDENRRHNLTFLSQWYLGWGKYDAVMDRYKDKTGSFSSAPDAVMHRYCGIDVDATWRLHQIFAKQLKQEGLVRPFKLEMDLLNCLADVEYRGIRIDKGLMLRLSDQYRKRQQEIDCGLKQTAAELLGDSTAEFNPRSTRQLASVLSAAGARLTKKTSGGSPSVDKLVLGALALRANTVPGKIASEVLELRTITKYVSTYLDGKEPLSGGFYVWVQDKDRIHPNYNVTVARTGRLSANDPPIQTIPRIGGLRSMFIPDVPGRDVFLSVDFSKIELCVMAWLANDSVMVEELISGIDLHTRMAVTARLMRDPTDQEWLDLAPKISKQERAISKSSNFGIPYGIGSTSIVDQNPSAFPDGMKREERVAKVDKVIRAYFEKYKQIALYRDMQIKTAQIEREIRTHLIGRKRHFSGMDWFDSKHARYCLFRDQDLGHLEREALNFQIQSIASDTLSRATKRSYDGIKQSGIKHFRIVMTLHDQLVFNCPKNMIDRAVDLIKGWMETTLPRDKHHRYEMPLKVDVAVQRYWGEAEYD